MKQSFKMRMKTLMLGLSLLMMGLSTAKVQAQDGSLVLDLQQCLEYAMANNQNVLNADLEKTKQEKVVKETLSIGYPQITANVELMNNFKVPTSFVPAEFFGGEPGEFIPVNFSPQYSGNASIGLTQMVFNGSYIVGVQAAKVFTDLSTKEYQRTRIDVAEGVIMAFYSVLVNEEGLALIENNYTRLDSLLRETVLMYENGFAEKIDVNRVKVEFNNSSAALRYSRDFVELSYQLLKFQMGLPIITDLQLDGSLNDLAEAVSGPSQQEYKYTDRIEYSILQTREMLANFELKNNKAQYLPNIDFFLNSGSGIGTGSSSDLFKTGNWFGYGNYGLSMHIPIFDGLTKSYKIQQNRIKLDQIKNQYSLLENTIDLEVQRARINLNYAIVVFSTQRENMDLSSEVYQVTKIKYQEGLGSNLEVIEADASLKSAQNKYYNAMYQVLISKVELEKSLGSLYQ